MVLFKGANALVHDCTLGYTDGMGFNGHSTISEAVRITELSGIPVLYPVHMSQENAQRSSCMASKTTDVKIIPPNVVKLI